MIQSSAISATATAPREDDADPGITLGLLQSVERDGAKSQRHLASELGIALGLVNAYVKRCINKGWLKATQAPAGRYAYYLTPRGFSEKSRLTVQYLAYSFSFFREAKADCIALFEVARSKGMTRVVLVGRSELAEIAAICAHDCQVEIVGVVDRRMDAQPLLRLPLAHSFDDIPFGFDALVITDLESPQDSVDQAMEKFGADRVLVPQVLHVRNVKIGDAP
jgi:hypothetical protein